MNYVRSKDAQKLLARTSLRTLPGWFLTKHPLNKNTIAFSGLCSNSVTATLALITVFAYSLQVICPKYEMSTLPQKAKDFTTLDAKDGFY